MRIHPARDFRPSMIDIWLCFTVLISTGLVCLVEAKTDAVKEILSKYKPLAMDESWSYVGSEFAAPRKVHAPNFRPFPPFEKSSSYMAQSTYADQAPVDDDLPSNDIERPSLPPHRVIDPTSLHMKLKQYDEWQGGDVKDEVFAMPQDSTKVTSKLTQLITQKEPTFVSEDSVAGAHFNLDGPNGTEKILASYKVLVPILIPATKIRVPTTKKAQVQFVKQQITEMVPVKKVVPVVKEVIKAEEVPHRVVTDFVATDSGRVPNKINSGISSNERVISSVVQNV